MATDTRRTSTSAAPARLEVPGLEGLELDPSNHWVWTGWRRTDDDPTRPTPRGSAVDPNPGRHAVRVLVVDGRRFPLGPVEDALRSLAPATEHPFASTLSVCVIRGSRLAVVTDLHRLGSLARVVELSGPAGIEEAIALGAEIAEALAHCHAVGYVHGHVGPASVMLGDDHHARLGSHGALGELEVALGVRPSPLGIEAPEGVASAAADVYALALTIVFAATGSTHPAALPIELAPLLGPLLAPDPKARRLSAAQLAHRLRLLAGPAVTVQGVGLDKVPARRRSARPLVIGAVALATTAAAAGGAWALLGPHTDPTPGTVTPTATTLDPGTALRVTEAPSSQPAVTTTVAPVTSAVPTTVPVATSEAPTTVATTIRQRTRARTTLGDPSASVPSTGTLPPDTEKPGG